MFFWSVTLSLLFHIASAHRYSGASRGKVLGDSDASQPSLQRQHLLIRHQHSSELQKARVSVDRLKEDEPAPTGLRSEANRAAKRTPSIALLPSCSAACTCVGCLLLRQLIVAALSLSVQIGQVGVRSAPVGTGAVTVAR